MCGIDKLTRVVVGHEATCLDHIFLLYNYPDRVSTDVIHTDITDQYNTMLQIITGSSEQDVQEQQRPT